MQRNRDNYTKNTGGEMKKNREKICHCLNPLTDPDYSICMKCYGQLGAYQQCLNCYNKRFVLFGNLYCSSQGKQKVSALKKQDHCAAQHQIRY